ISMFKTLIVFKIRIYSQTQALAVFFSTMSSECLKKVELHNGQNAIVAVNVHYGYNQEDSVVLNHASIDRGLFRTMHFHTFTSEIDCDDSNSKSSSKLDLDF
ncbi:hypothetical protein KI387_019215, partial [Taxus chinensis]